MSLQENTLTWQIEISLINNRFIIRNVVKAIGLTLILLFIIFGLIFGFTGGLKGIGQALVVCLWVGLFVALVSAFTLVVFLGNKLLLEFSITDEGIIMKNKSGLSRVAHRLALVLGLLSRKMATAGAGVSGMSGETIFCPWNEIGSIKAYPDKRVIAARQNFFETMYVYCTEDNFKDVSGLIAEKSGKNIG
jgi:hypothetical protein